MILLYRKHERYIQATFFYRGVVTHGKIPLINLDLGRAKERAAMQAIKWCNPDSLPLAAFLAKHKVEIKEVDNI